jgi:UDP-3-O-[3-hydroxymyristoyl] glucosamine N-acyltransferase
MIHKTAIIHKHAIIGNNVSIGAYAVIGDCILGDDCIIHPHVFIGDNVIIEKNVEIFNGAVIGKEPKGAGATSRPIEFKKYISIEKNVSISPHAIIYYDVKIGENTLIGDGASIREQCRIGNFCIISRYVTINYNTWIGNRVKIMDLSHITGNMTINDDVFISALVGSANDNKITSGYGDHIKGASIEQGAIVGLGSMLLPNISIGQKAFIAAGAIVTKSIRNKKLALGIPAKEIKDID